MVLVAFAVLSYFFIVLAGVAGLSSSVLHTFCVALVSNVPVMSLRGDWYLWKGFRFKFPYSLRGLEYRISLLSIRFDLEEAEGRRHVLLLQYKLGLRYHNDAEVSVR